MRCYYAHAQAAMVFKRIENLNYAVDLGKGPFGFSLVGVQGKDIVDGNRKLTLAIIWQLFRYHLVSFLTDLRKKAGGGTDTELKDEDMVRRRARRHAALLRAVVQCTPSVHVCSHLA